MDDESAGPIAEFTALRQEIERRAVHGDNILALQLSSVGAVFGFALSNPDLLVLLFVLPTTSFLLATTYERNMVAQYEAARYIADELSGRVPGGLNWEQWRRDQAFRVRSTRFTHPTTITFVGPSLLALGWIIAVALYEPGDLSWIAWPAGALATTAGLCATWASSRITLRIATSGGRRVPWNSSTQAPGPSQP